MFRHGLGQAKLTYAQLPFRSSIQFISNILINLFSHIVFTTHAFVTTCVYTTSIICITFAKTKTTTTTTVNVNAIFIIYCYNLSVYLFFVCFVIVFFYIFVVDFVDWCAISIRCAFLLYVGRSNYADSS